MTQNTAGRPIYYPEYGKFNEFAAQFILKLLCKKLEWNDAKSRKKF